MEKTIYLMRHGETEMNRRECLQGQIDCELNETGINEAKNTARILQKAGIRFDAVYTSPLKRAAKTAEIAAGGCPVTVEPLITEMHFGSYEGMPYRDIDEKMWAFIHDPEHVRPPEGVESIQSLTDRTGRALEKIIRGDGKSILVTSHGIALRSILWNIYEPAARSRVWSMPIENCVIYILRVQDGRPADIRKADELSVSCESDTSGVF